MAANVGAQGLICTPATNSSGNGLPTTINQESDWIGGDHYGNIYLDGYNSGWHVQHAQNQDVKYNTILAPRDDYDPAPNTPSIRHTGPHTSAITGFVCTKNIVAGSSPTGTDGTGDNITGVLTKAQIQVYYSGTNFGSPALETKAGVLAQMVPTASAAGYGAIGTGCDHDAQTCSMPDGFTYSRTYPLT